MEDNQGHDHHHHRPNSPTSHGSSSSNNTSERNNSNTEPVRSRWTPKPEQILILESIFNSGMVNPPKDETVRIRKLLEKFGSVGDANVFYWFQNRRSRSRRRQRQMLAASLEQRNNIIQQGQAAGGVGGAIQFENSVVISGTSSSFGGFVNNSPSFGASPSASFLGISSSSSSSSCGVGGGDDGTVENLFSASYQMGFQEMDQNSSITSILSQSDHTSNLQYQTGFITVFINGMATEVPRGPLDMKGMFGEDVMLVHSSGMPLPVNEFGLLMQSLHHGESYFLVSRPT